MKTCLRESLPSAFPLLWFLCSFWERIISSILKFTWVTFQLVSYWRREFLFGTFLSLDSSMSFIILCFLIIIQLETRKRGRRKEKFRTKMNHETLFSSSIVFFRVSDSLCIELHHCRQKRKRIENWREFLKGKKKEREKIRIQKRKERLISSKNWQNLVRMREKFCCCATCYTFFSTDLYLNTPFWIWISRTRYFFDFPLHSFSCIV